MGNSSESGTWTDERIQKPGSEDSARRIHPGLRWSNGFETDGRSVILDLESRISKVNRLIDEESRSLFFDYRKRNGEHFRCMHAVRTRTAVKKTVALRYSLERHDRQMPATGDEVDFESEICTGLASRQCL